MSSFVQDRNTLDCLRCVDKALAHVPRDKIREQLLEVGFDKSRQTEIVGGLSGGWKMKLELARAMLYNADLLLLDEVRCMISRCRLTRIDCCFVSQPTNHVCDLHFWQLGPVSSTGFQLDRASVTWLEEYLIAHTNVTCLIVSHDSRSVSNRPFHMPRLIFLLRFLDNVTTDIMHYEEKKVCSYLMPRRRHNL